MQLFWFNVHLIFPLPYSCGIWPRASFSVTLYSMHLFARLPWTQQSTIFSLDVQTETSTKSTCMLQWVWNLIPNKASEINLFVVSKIKHSGENIIEVCRQSKYIGHGVSWPRDQAHRTWVLVFGFEFPSRDTRDLYHCKTLDHCCCILQRSLVHWPQF